MWDVDYCISKREVGIITLIALFFFCFLLTIRHNQLVIVSRVK